METAYFPTRVGMIPAAGMMQGVIMGISHTREDKPT